MPSLERWCSSRWEEVVGIGEESRRGGVRDRGLARVIPVRSAPMIGRERQTAIYLGGVSGRRPRVPLDPERLEEAAPKAMPADAFAHIKAGAGTEGTLRENPAPFARHPVVPRVLRGGPRARPPGPPFGPQLRPPL